MRNPLRALVPHMAEPKYALYRNIAAYILITGVLTTMLGFIEQSNGQRLHWIVFYLNFAILLAVLDLPLLVLALWMGARIDATTERVMAETLDRSLTIATRLFIEHWNAERERGALPTTPVVTQPPPVDAPE